MTYPVRIMPQSTVSTAFPSPRRRLLTPFEHLLNDAAVEAEEQGVVLVYHMDAETKEFTGFSKLNKR